MSWKPDSFEIAMPEGPVRKQGYVYRGLGLHLCIEGSPKGRRPPVWTLSHLGTGHRIATIKGKVAEAFPVASEIAESGDWEFESLWGWKDRFPDVSAKFAEIMARYPKQLSRGVGGPAHEDVARAVAMGRP